MHVLLRLPPDPGAAEHGLSDRVTEEGARLAALRAAAEKLERAVALHPRDFAVVYNAARAQLALARALGQTKPGDAALHLASATDLFQKAITCAFRGVCRSPL